MKNSIYNTWVLCDREGRVSPINKAIKENHEIGMFYFLWHDNTCELLDNNQAYLDGGVEGVWDIVPKGEIGKPHYWGQPAFGYYRSTDRWVIRKHCAMLSAAGVDFIFFDCSNGLYYPEESTAVFEVFSECKKEGMKVPKILYFNGDTPELSKTTIEGVYDLFYKDGRFKDLWYYLDGKPLILGNTSLIKNEEILNFFTFRRSWAYKIFDLREWYDETEGKGCWPWADLYPQVYGYDNEGNPEQMIVMCGFWANSSQGRSFHNGQQPTDNKNDFEFGLMETTTPLGLGFKEQFDHAIKADPPRIMVTGWNEWWAGRWNFEHSSGQKIANQWVIDMNSDDETFRSNYVDNFNPEFSRDLEPMKGGFEDNYYCQLVSNVREYKGYGELPKSSGRKTINCKEDFDSVGPIFNDTLFDTCSRDAGSNCGNLHYVDNSGRNDIDFAKVCRDEKYTYFYVSTREKLILSDERNWMNLFISIYPDTNLGLAGYTYLLNRNRKDGVCSVEKTDGGWNFYEIGKADLEIGENYIIIKVENQLIGLGSTDVTFDFKWADNSVDDGDVMDFYLKGDAAPDGRFKFRYTEK